MREYTENATGTKIRKIRKIKLTLCEITGLHIRTPHTPHSQISNEPTCWERMSCPTAFLPPLPFPTWCHMVQTATEIREACLDLDPCLLRSHKCMTIQELPEN